MEVATFGKITGHFSPIVPPSAAGVRSRLFRRGGQPGGGSWNVLITGPSGWGFDVLRILINDSWTGQNPLGLQCRLKKNQNRCAIKNKLFHNQILNKNDNSRRNLVRPLRKECLAMLKISKENLKKKKKKTCYDPSTLLAKTLGVENH